MFASATSSTMRNNAGTHSTHDIFDKCVSLLCLAVCEWHRDTNFIGYE